MIQFKVNKRWTVAAVAHRCADLVRPHNPGWAPQPRDGKIQLDPGNDWFLEKKGEDLYELRTRYMTPEKQAALEGLKLFLEEVVFA